MGDKPGDVLPVKAKMDNYGYHKNSPAGWSFNEQGMDSNLKGGGCGPSILCDIEAAEKDIPSDSIDVRHVVAEERLDESAFPDDTDLLAKSSAWKGWAELENDPDIFTAILHEWGARKLRVNEVLDVGQLIFEANPSDISGLIFLSRYQSEQQNDPLAVVSTPGPANDTSSGRANHPWFANQISKFSCGTVALMNIMMNVDEATTELSRVLTSFKRTTLSMPSKQRGIALDASAAFRDLHNSFSTKLDRMIVDVLLKDEAQRYNARKQAEARQAKRAQADPGSSKRKRGRAPFTQKRQRRSASSLDEEEENGFHFVAYLSVNGSVWKLDGLQKNPEYLGRPTDEQTWLNVAAADLMARMQQAFDTGQECSLMDVSRADSGTSVQEALTGLDKTRKQEDWAPFIEHMLRLHAEKGDLQEMLGMINP